MNPIIQMLTQSNNMIGIINQLKNGNPQEIYNNMMNTNQDFRMFVNANKGKSAEQIAQENGIDLSLIKQFLK